MGIFYTDCEVVNIKSPIKKINVKRLLVDTGAEFSWIPEQELKQIGIVPVKKDKVFVMANGKHITRSTGYAIIRLGEFETVDEIVFGISGDLKLLGVRTIEGFGVTIDPRKKKFVAAGPEPVA